MCIRDSYQLMQPWHMTDDEGRLDLVFTPLLDRVDWMDFKPVSYTHLDVYKRQRGYTVNSPPRPVWPIDTPLRTACSASTICSLS